MAYGSRGADSERIKKLEWGTACLLLVAESPESYDCQQCELSGRKNRIRGRDCLLKRDYKKNPIPYLFKTRNTKPKKGIIESEDGLYKAITIAMDVYRTSDTNIALRRIGKGVCPKSFPITPQSYYFLDVYSLTHGGEYGNTLLNLPLSGGVLDQPSIFYNACSIISSVRNRYTREQLGGSDDKNKGLQSSSVRGDGKGQNQGYASSFG